MLSPPYRSLSDQLYGTPEHFDYVREQVVNRLAFERAHYQPYVPGDYTDYVTTMGKEGTWGDHVTLQVCYST